MAEHAEGRRRQLAFRSDFPKANQQRVKILEPQGALDSITRVGDHGTTNSLSNI